MIASNRLNTDSLRFVNFLIKDFSMERTAFVTFSVTESSETAIVVVTNVHKRFHGNSTYGNGSGGALVVAVVGGYNRDLVCYLALVE